MMTTAEAEQIWVQTFVVRDRRERFATLLASEKRSKALRNLSHQLEFDLDPRFIFDKDNPPLDVAAQVAKVLTRWQHANPAQRCHILTHGRLPHEMMNLQEAENDYQLHQGVVIIIIPNVLAYYHTERSNLSKQPYYILFHAVNGQMWKP